METCTIIPGTKTYREVKRLYLSAFPPEERRPFFSLWLLSAMKAPVSLRAYRDGNTLCGFVLSVDSGKYLYISFIAVNPALRGQGCGSRMLDTLRQQHSGRPLLVEVEAPDPAADNQSQRQKRMAFYAKNGFFDLDRTITGRGVTYKILSTEEAFDRAAYREIFPLLSFGLRARLRELLNSRSSGKETT